MIFVQAKVMPYFYGGEQMGFTEGLWILAADAVGMEFTQGAWWILVGAASIAVTIISYFLKRTMSKQDEHDRDIAEIKRNYVTKNDHQRDITEIKTEIRQVSKDISSLKDTTLTKADFYRSMGRTEEKLDKLQEILINRTRGGDTNG